MKMLSKNFDCLRWDAGHLGDGNFFWNSFLHPRPYRDNFRLFPNLQDILHFEKKISFKKISKKFHVKNFRAIEIFTIFPCENFSQEKIREKNFLSYWTSGPGARGYTPIVHGIRPRPRGGVPLNFRCSFRICHYFWLIRQKIFLNYLQFKKISKLSTI